MTPEAYDRLVIDLDGAFRRGNIYQSVKLQFGNGGGLITFTKIEWESQPDQKAKLELVKTRAAALQNRIKLK